MERSGPPPEETPYVSMREHLRRRREKQYQPVEELNDSALAALFLSQWAHPSTPSGRIVEAILGPDVPNLHEPIDPWQERLDDILDNPRRTFVMKDDDPLREYFNESYEHLGGDDFDKKTALIKAAEVYCVSRSELSPQPTHVNARTVIYKILQADYPPAPPDRTA